MSRWVGLAIVIVLLGLGYFAYAHPEWLPQLQGSDGRVDLANLVWLIMALLLVSGAAFGFQRIRGQPSAALWGLVFWPAALIVIALLYTWLN